MTRKTGEYFDTNFKFSYLFFLPILSGIISNITIVYMHITLMKQNGT